MHSSLRSKKSALLSVLTIMTVVGAFMVTFATHNAGATGAAKSSSGASSATVSYTGKPLTTTQTSTSAGLPTKVVKDARPINGPIDLEALNPFADNGPGE